MVLSLVIILAVGLGTAGLAFGSSRVRGHNPKAWAIAIAAVGAMFGAHIVDAYDWADRTLRAMDEDLELAAYHFYASAIPPWTLVFPRINRLEAVDVAGARRDVAAPNYVFTRVFTLERFDHSDVRHAVFDRVESRRAVYEAGETPGRGRISL